MTCGHCAKPIAREDKGYITVKGRELTVHQDCALWISAHRDRLP